LPGGPNVAVGEHWAYRARWQDPLIEVRVVRVGVKTPLRVFVRWVDDEFEGHQDWVPATRLKVRWEDIDAYRERERRWEAVTAEAVNYPETLTQAISAVFRLVEDDVAELGWSANERGAFRIHEPARLAELAGLAPGDLRTEVSFDEDGDLLSPMSIALLVARRLAEREPHKVLADVEREEAKARREAIHGRYYRGRGPNGGWEVSAEICRQVDEEHGQPVRVLLRQWCGAEAVDVRAEIAAASDEAARLASLATAALDALRQAGHGRIANKIERDFGPVRGSDRKEGGKR
jgi:hypothetical protein